MITYEVFAGGFEEDAAVFEEVSLAKKCRFEALQREPAFDGWVVETGLLQHLEEVEDLVAYGLVLDDLMVKQGGA